MAPHAGRFRHPGRRVGLVRFGADQPEDLQAGLKLSGVLPQPVSILAVAAHGSDAVTVTFQDVQGTLGRVPALASIH